MPAISYLGTSLPGGRVSFVVAAGPGNGVGRGTAGDANTPLMGTALLVAAGLFAAALFSAAAPLFPSPVPLLFCWAHRGTAKNAPIASIRHDLRIAILREFVLSRPA